MKKILTALSILVALSAVSADFGFEADFSRPVEQIILKNGAVVENGLLRFAKSRSYAEVAGSAGYDFTGGGTLMAVCRFNDLAAQPDKFRFLFSKGDSFLFGLTGGKYNFSICHDKRWSIALIGGTPPVEGEWVHLAAVARRVNDKEQGRFGFQLEIYVNGERLLGKFVQWRELICDKTAPVILGTPNKNTHFNGDFNEASFVNRALSAHEIAEAARGNKLVKITVPGIFEPDASLMENLKTLQVSARNPFEKFIAASLYKAAATGAPPEKVVHGIRQAEELFADKNISDAALIEKFNGNQEEFQLLAAGNSVLFLIGGEGGKAFPVIDIYDVHAGCGIFGDRANSWHFRFHAGDRRNLELNDFSPEVSVKTSPAVSENGKYHFTVSWKHPEIEVRSEASFCSRGLRMDLKAKALAKDVMLFETRFPQWGLARKSGEDFLVTPFMSGLLVPNPVENYSHERDFPCAQNAMQFQGYFSSGGDGVYVALEDPYATARSTAVFGSRKQLFITWRTACPREIDGGGGNSFSLGGDAVIRLYRGGWFEAGKLYKEFLSERASWWIPDLPRRSTPEWFRSNSIWILAGVKPDRNEATLHYLRKYFDQEFGVHLVGTTAARIWPHFDRTTPRGMEFTKSMQEAGIRIAPYSDPRLWAEVNMDGSKGWQESSIAMAVKKEDGPPMTEFYNVNCLVLCPASSAWQKEYLRICAAMASQGFDGIYHDQLPCGHSAVCFDPGHGHKLNDPAIWIRDGYAEMYRKLHEALDKKYPELVHTGEDASDPFLKMIDGYTCWRWTEPNAIPLFQSIYAGRIQFTGKLYNHQHPGDWESNFAKAASQLVNAEQLGWITLEDLEAATPFRKYFKTLAWVRRALLEYFNTAERLPPLEFTRSPGKMYSVWGNTGVDGLRVDSDIIRHSVWRLPDGRIMALFLNATDVPQQTEAVWPYDGKFFRICRQDTAIPQTVEKFPMVELPPYGVEIRLVSPADNAAEAGRIAAVLYKTSSFDEGETLSLRAEVSQEVPANLNIRKDRLMTVNEAQLYTNTFRRYYANGLDKDIVLILYDGSKIRYTGLNFGKDICSRISIAAAFDRSEVNGEFEVFSGGKKIGEAVLEKGGRYLDFNDIPVKLNQDMTGGSKDLEIIFRGKSCRFKGWKAL